MTNGWGVDRGLVVLSKKISSFSELLDMVEQSKKIVYEHELLASKSKFAYNIYFFLTEILNWFNIYSA